MHIFAYDAWIYLGAVKQGGSVSKVLKRVDVPILSNQACNMTKYAGKITDNMYDSLPNYIMLWIMFMMNA